MCHAGSCTNHLFTYGSLCYCIPIFKMFNQFDCVLQNDEGAPLMCFSDTTYSWELQGLLSHHDNCGSNKHPAIFTAIEPKLKSWIINTVGEQGFVKRSIDS